jgi:hypothetical protein
MSQIRKSGPLGAQDVTRKLESAFKDGKVRPFLKTLKNTWAVKIQQMGISGTPDILACIGGVFVALELKRDYKSRVTPLQKYNLDLIRNAGGVALCACPENWDEIKSFLTMLAHRPINQEFGEIHAKNQLL